ncbi:MAG: acetoacetate--CoA ligase [Ferrimicrobium sp.]
MTASEIKPGQILWEPGEDAQVSPLARFLERFGPEVNSYDDLWRASIGDPERFWGEVWSATGVVGDRGALPWLEGTLPDARFFPNAVLNYAECAHARFRDPAGIYLANEEEEMNFVPATKMWADVARMADGLREQGIGVGDRVVAYLPNIYESVVALLATASIGALWSCCSPDFGVGAVVDRFSQIEPRVFVTVAGYRYNGRFVDRSEAVTAIVSALGTLEQVVVVGDPGSLDDSRAVAFADFGRAGAELSFTRVGFNDPLWVVYSSGTTGIPKAIVHGHGGIVLEHKKVLEFQSGIREGSTFFWYTSTGWMMWNFLVGGLQVGSSIVLYDGAPGYPDLGRLWRLIDGARINYFGVSAPYLRACQVGGVDPSSEGQLSTLRVIGSTGAPLTVDGFGWVERSVPARVQLVSASGGTDVCTAFLGSSPLHPTIAGRISTRALGVAAAAFDDDGREVVGSMGELVITKPMPSMPVGLWNDDDRSRYHAAYFGVFPGVWRHGDWITFYEDGTSVIFGRSDSTLNRGGVRMGTAEFYRVVEAVPGVLEALVVDTSSIETDGQLVLFVACNAEWERCKEEIRSRLRRELSPRHVPDVFMQVEAIPHTLNGKKLEVPIRRLLLGEQLARVASLDAVQDPATLEYFAELASRWREAGSAS